MSELNGEVGSVEVSGWPVHYEKFGNGPEVLLLIPGAVGTGRSDFWPQLVGQNAFDQEQYTLICIELPGWGRSRPPIRKYNNLVFVQDAVCAIRLMETLGYKSYSVIGWSDGAKVALVIGYRAPAKVKCLVVSGVFLKVSQQTVAPTLKTEDTYMWPKELRDNYLRSYDAETLQMLWSNHIEFCKKFHEIFPNGSWTNNLRNIRCPVLIIHGDRDVLCNPEHALHAEKEIPCSRLHRFPRGGHNCHQTYAADFRRITEQFIKESDSY